MQESFSLPLRYNFCLLVFFFEAEKIINLKKRKQKNLKQKNKSSRCRKTNLRTVSDVISEILFIVTIQFYGEKNTYLDETAHILIIQGENFEKPKN